MSNLNLRVLLPINRDRSGSLRVEKDGRPIAEFVALGRGSRGQGDTSLLENGNTPTGEYKGAELQSTENRDRNSYGPWGAVRLRPVSGAAFLAERIGGRSGLLIHGGSVGSDNYWRGAGALRATHGCIRVSNADMRRLRQILEDAGLADDSCVSPTVTVSVEEH